jgi:hypothetical protein
MASMGYAERHSDSLRAYCQAIRVNQAPAEQTAQIAVELPPFVPDGSGGGAGAGSGSATP